MIWNGVPFNALCVKSPELTITAYHRMLALMLEPDVHSFLCFDFRTWFVQIQVTEEVAGFFACRFPQGDLYTVAGVPMGWTWACAIAHALTQAFARLVMSEMGLTRAQVTMEFCIDNTIFAIRDKNVSASELWAAVLRTAARLGIVLKESATEMGTEVDWLPYRLSLRSRSATFKASYREKLMALRATAQQDSAELLAVWRAVGLLLFSLYAARVPFTRARDILRWLGAHAPSPEDKEAWLTPVRFPLWDLVHSLLDELCAMVIKPPPLPSSRCDAWFVSDSAGGHGGNNVFILFSRTTTSLCVWPRRDEDIASSELRAHIAGAVAALEFVSVGSTLVGFGDNVVALSAQRRGYALWANASLADETEGLARRLEAHRVYLASPYVPSAACLADVWTRGAKSGRTSWPACAVGHALQPGVLCGCAEKNLRNAAPEAAMWSRTFHAWLQQPQWSIREPTGWEGDSESESPTGS